MDMRGAVLSTVLVLAFVAQSFSSPVQATSYERDLANLISKANILLDRMLELTEKRTGNVADVKQEQAGDQQLQELQELSNTKSEASNQRLEERNEEGPRPETESIRKRSFDGEGLHHHSDKREEFDYEPERSLDESEFYLDGVSQAEPVPDTRENINDDGGDDLTLTDLQDAIDLLRKLRENKHSRNYA